jgi:hypothetical protein
MGRMAVPEPSPAGRRGPVPWDTWQHRSPPQQGGEAQSHRTRDSVRDLLGRLVGSGAVGHVAAPEPSLAGR